MLRNNLTRGDVPFAGMLPPALIGGQPAQLLHVSTPFGRITVGAGETFEHPGLAWQKVQAGPPLPESTRSLPQGPIDDRLASL
jgi:hypothetical protein